MLYYMKFVFVFQHYKTISFNLSEPSSLLKEYLTKQ